jgi:hypothetical protein
VAIGSTLRVQLFFLLSLLRTGYSGALGFNGTKKAIGCLPLQSPFRVMIMMLGRAPVLQETAWRLLRGQTILKEITIAGENGVYSRMG